MSKKAKDDKSKLDGYYGTLNELFERDGALDKFSKVRYAYFEIYELWWGQGIPWECLELQAKKYFMYRFLGGKHVDNVSREVLLKALQSLKFAVGIPVDENSKPTGCYARFLRIVEKLNEEGEKLGYKKLTKTSVFMNYYTFWPKVARDFDGNPKVDYETGGIESELVDRRHRLAFRRELEKVIKNDEEIDIFEIAERARKKTEGNCPAPNPDDKADKGPKFKPA